MESLGGCSTGLCSLAIAGPLELVSGCRRPFQVTLGTAAWRAGRLPDRDALITLSRERHSPVACCGGCKQGSLYLAACCRG